MEEMKENLPKETLIELKTNYKRIEIYHQEQINQMIEGYSNLNTNVTEVSKEIKDYQPFIKLVRNGCKSSFQSQIKSTI